MPVTTAEHVAVLSGTVTVEDAEPLAEFLRRTPGAAVRLAECTHLHTAALQVLLAARPALLSPPSDPFLARWIAPLLGPGPDAGEGREG